MDTTIAFIELLAGFAPFAAIVATIVIALWAATKLFPKFGAMVDTMSDELFGVSVQYDQKNETGFRIHPSNYSRV